MILGPVRTPAIVGDNVREAFEIASVRYGKVVGSVVTS